MKISAVVSSVMLLLLSQMSVAYADTAKPETPVKVAEGVAATVKVKSNDTVSNSDSSSDLKFKPSYLSVKGHRDVTVRIGLTQRFVHNVIRANMMAGKALCMPIHLTILCFRQNGRWQKRL